MDRTVYILHGDRLTIGWSKVGFLSYSCLPSFPVNETHSQIYHNRQDCKNNCKVFPSRQYCPYGITSFKQYSSTLPWVLRTYVPWSTP